MKRVSIISINAGGGHIAAMNSLAQILSSSKKFDVSTYIIKDSHLDNLHKNLVFYFPFFYEFLYNLSKLPLPNLINNLRILVAAKVNKLDNQILPFLYNSDIIISTHFIITEQLLRLRHNNNLKVKIVNYIPDFDEANIHKVHYKSKYCDGYIAQSPNLVQSFLNKNIPAIEGRFIPSSNFNRTDRSNTELLSILNNGLENKIKLNFDKPIICVTGGAMWAKRLMPRLKYLWKNDKANKYIPQYIIVTGKNRSFFDQLLKSKDKYTGANIQAVPFLNSKQLASLYKLSSIILMASIAPASLYEIGATNNAVIVLGRKNPGQEYFNARYAKENNLIISANGKTLLSNSVLSLFNNSIRIKKLAEQQKAFEIEKRIQSKFEDVLVNFVNQL